MGVHVCVCGCECIGMHNDINFANTIDRYHLYNIYNILKQNIVGYTLTTVPSHIDVSSLDSHYL